MRRPSLLCLALILHAADTQFIADDPVTFANALKGFQDTQKFDYGNANVAQYMTNIRTDVLNTAIYDKHVPPVSIRGETDSDVQLRFGTDVEIQVRFVRVVSVQPTAGIMTLKIWMRMYWTDTRLAWDPSNPRYGNVTEFYSSPIADDSESETSEIWIPDITIYNGNGPTNGMFEPQRAWVGSNGRVALSRPGNLELLCKFSGLVAFPFDTLQCQFDVGGWYLSGVHQGILPRARNFTASCAGTGFYELAYEYDCNHRSASFDYFIGTWGSDTFDSNTHESVGNSYSDFDINQVTASKQILRYASDPTPYPFVAYKVHLKRFGMTFYSLGVILPDLLLTVVALFSFVPRIDSELGAQRMTLGITVVLVMQVEGVAIASWLPVCNELLWIQIFVLINLLIAYAALFETMLVQLLAHKTGRTILPTWMVVICGTLVAKVEAVIERMLHITARVRGRKRAHRQSAEQRRLAVMGDTSAFGVTSYAGVVLRQELMSKGVPVKDMSTHVQAIKRAKSATRKQAEAHQNVQEAMHDGGRGSPEHDEAFDRFKKIALATGSMARMKTSANILSALQSSGASSPSSNGAAASKYEPADTTSSEPQVPTWGDEGDNSVRALDRSAPAPAASASSGGFRDAQTAAAKSHVASRLKLHSGSAAAKVEANWNKVKQVANDAAKMAKWSEALTSKQPSKARKAAHTYSPPLTTPPIPSSKQLWRTYSSKWIMSIKAGSPTAQRQTSSSSSSPRPRLRAPTSS